MAQDDLAPWQRPNQTLKELDAEAGIEQKGASATASRASAASSAASADRTRTLLPSEARKSQALATKAEYDAEKAKLAIEKARAALSKRPQPENLEEARKAVSVELKNALEARKLSREMFGASGIGHTTTSLYSGSPGASVNALLKPIQANTAFNRLQKMRAESPTGGALGAVSDTELKLLYSGEDALDPTAGDEVFQNGLDTIIGNRIDLLSKLGAEPADVAAILPPEEFDRYAPRIKAYRFTPEDTKALSNYVDTARKGGTYDPTDFAALMGEAYYNATGRAPDNKFIDNAYRTGAQLSDPEAGLGAFDYTEADKGVQELLTSGAYAPKKDDIGVGETLGGAALNFVPSTFEFAFDTAKALTADLPQTLDGVAQVVGGATGLSDDTAALDALKQYYTDRYGSVEGFQQALKTDPASIAADIAGIATGGGTILAKTANVGAKVSKIGALSNAARASEAFAATAAKLDPLAMAGAMTRKAGNAAGAVGEALAINLPARQAGVTGAEVKQAFGAGRRGSAEFVDQLEGVGDPVDPLTKASAAVGELYEARSRDYSRRMAKMDKTETLDWADIEDAITKVENVGRYKGIDISAASGVWGDIFDIADQFKAKGLNTIEDFDAMKRAMHNIKGKYQLGTPEHKVAKDVAKAVNDTIVAKAPVYANIMRDYRLASDVLSDVQSTLSLKAGSADTALGKLQRTVAQKGPRGRTVLDLLESTNSGKGLGDLIAGQALSGKEPKGMAGALTGPAAIASGDPEVLAGAMVTPQALGRKAYSAGKAYGSVADAMTAVRSTPFAQRLEAMGAKYGPSASRALTVANPALIQPQADPYKAPPGAKGLTAEALAALRAKYSGQTPRAVPARRGPTLDAYRSLEPVATPGLSDYATEEELAAEESQ